MKTQIKTILILVLGFLMVLFSCKKDKPPISLPGVGCCSDNCPEMYEMRSTPLPDTLHKTNSLPGCIITPNFIPMGNYGYIHPVVNPNNDYEISFIRNDNVNFSPSGELCVYNFCSNQLKVIASNARSSPDWSVKDWIIFTGDDNQLWKVKSSGDSLTQLTNTGTFNNRPRWNLDGDKFVYFDASISGQSRIAHENGQSYKILEFFIDRSLWLSSEEIIYSNQGNNQLRRYNLETDEMEQIVSGYGIAGGKISKMDDGKLNFDGHHATYFYDNPNLIVIDSNYVTFRNFSSQPIGDNKLLFNRLVQDTTDYEDCIVYSWRLLTIYDLETEEEREINLPE